MPVTETVGNAFEGEEHEEQVRQGINNLGRVNGCIVVLESIRVPPSSGLSLGCNTSSHQFNVEVTGSQYPRGRVDGYGIDGSQEPTVFAAIVFKKVGDSKKGELQKRETVLRLG